MAMFEVVLASKDGKRGADYRVEAADTESAVAQAQGDSPGFLTEVVSVEQIED